MNTRSPRDVLLLDLTLAGIDEGLIETEQDLARLYAWLLEEAGKVRAHVPQNQRRSPARGGSSWRSSPQ